MMQACLTPIAVGKGVADIDGVITAGEAQMAAILQAACIGARIIWGKLVLTKWPLLTQTIGGTSHRVSATIKKAARPTGSLTGIGFARRTCHVLLTRTLRASGPHR